MEEIEFTTDLAVIALLGFLKLGQVLVQLFFIAPCSAVNALQGLVVGVTSPVCTGQLHQLERLR